MVYFFSCPGLQTVRPQLRLPHIRQRLPDTQVKSSLSHLKRCRQFFCSLRGQIKHTRCKIWSNLFCLSTDLVSKLRRLFTLLSTRRRSRRRTRWSRTKSFLRWQKNSSSHCLGFGQTQTILLRQLHSFSIFLADQEAVWGSKRLWDVLKLSVVQCSV